MAFGLTGFISDTASTLASIVSHQVAFINNKVKQAQVQQQPSTPPPPAAPATPLAGAAAVRAAMQASGGDNLPEFQAYVNAQKAVETAQARVAAAQSPAALQTAQDALNPILAWREASRQAYVAAVAKQNQDIAALQALRDDPTGSPPPPVDQTPIAGSLTWSRDPVPGAVAAPVVEGDDDALLGRVHSTFQAHQQAQEAAAAAQQNVSSVIASGGDLAAISSALSVWNEAHAHEFSAKQAYDQASYAAMYEGATTAGGARLPTGGADIGQWTRVTSPAGISSHERINADGTLNQSYVVQNQAGDQSVLVYNEATDEKVTIRDNSTQTQYVLYNDANGLFHATKNGQEFDVNSFMNQDPRMPTFTLPVNEVAIEITVSRDDQTGQFKARISDGGVMAHHGGMPFLFDAAPR